MKKTSKVPIKKIDGIELIPTNQTGIVRVELTNPKQKNSLSWDRFVRLKKTAFYIQKHLKPGSRILDIGGYDGALAFFIEDYIHELIDPETTGLDLLELKEDGLSYDLVAAIDVLEHVPPEDRNNWLKHLLKLASKQIIINYPHRETIEAQKIIFNATGNNLIEEHCKWPLPDTKQVIEILNQGGFEANATSYGNLAVWLGQYLSMNLNPDKARDLNEYLISNHQDEPFTTPLYDLIFASKQEAL